jgi:hypothetical protein
MPAATAALVVLWGQAELWALGRRELGRGDEVQGMHGLGFGQARAPFELVGYPSFAPGLLNPLSHPVASSAALPKPSSMTNFLQEIDALSQR